MFDHGHLIMALGLVVIAMPVVLLCALGISSLIDRKLSETATSRLCQGTIVLGLVAALSILALMLLHGTRHESIELGHWISLPGYHFSVKLIFDRLSVPFAILSFVLCGTIGAFASRYMHREPGYNRFFTLYAVFVMGVILTSLAGTIETLFAGWELVGLSSVLLVAFFQERPSPVRNGLWVWVIYRVSDAALLLAAIVLHHLHGEGDFDLLLEGGYWPEGHPAVTGMPILGVGLLLLVAAAGKSALVPFSGWLPRAMEGPTPSSAVFYGALSVHLGAFLLLRISPILDASPILAVCVVAIGLSTAVFAYFTGSVQTDIKSTLTFASLVQVGLIVAEIGVGLRYIALIHLLGNACMRTLQFVRAPSLLADYHQLENALGDHLPQSSGALERAFARFRARLYRFCMERGYLDVLLTTVFVTPVARVFLACDRWERRWTEWLAGESTAARDQASTHQPHAGRIEDLL